MSALEQVHQRIEEDFGQHLEPTRALVRQPSISTEGTGMAEMAYLDRGELPEAYHHTPDFLEYGFGGQLSLFPEAYTIFLNPILGKILGRVEFRIGDQSLTSKMVDLIRERWR